MAKKNRIGPPFALFTSVLLWERERTKNTNRLALAMGEVVHRAGWVFLRTSDLEAFRFALAMGEVVQRSGRLFLLHPRHEAFLASPFVGSMASVRSRKPDNHFSSMSRVCGPDCTE